MQEWKDQGLDVQFIPSKGVYTQKSGDGRLRARIVACGNYAQAPELAGATVQGPGGEAFRNKLRQAKQALYAGGQDVLSLRAQLRQAGLRQWSSACLDVKTAFLLAPLQFQNRRIVLRPPRLLTQLSLVPKHELWAVDGAIYGLQESPAAWCAFRDQQLQDLRVPFGDRTLKLQQSRADCNTWLVVDARPELQGEMLGVLGCYVDDILIREVQRFSKQSLLPYRPCGEHLHQSFPGKMAGSLFADCRQVRTMAPRVLCFCRRKNT